MLSIDLLQNVRSVGHYNDTLFELKLNCDVADYNDILKSNTHFPVIYGLGKQKLNCIVSYIK